MLYVVSTPIGNLKDITYRAVETLCSVDLIAAEDTRHTRRLLRHYQIETPLTSYFEHNEVEKGRYLMQRMRQGAKVALVSDAGTPGISDPGYKLICQARDAAIPVQVVPGACALIAGLTLSALPSHRFVFEGFLPVKAAARRRRLAAFVDEERTVIFYESPHRLARMLRDVAEVLDDPWVVCVREITKVFEEARQARASEHVAYFSQKKPRGEFVILVRIEDKSPLGSKRTA